MRASLPAEARRKETLLKWDSSSEKFVSWTKGDVANVDQFLSNFHKPLQRRMVHISPKVDLPESGVIKVKSTGQVYLISEPRDDAKNDEAFDRLCVLHLVSGAAGGLVEFFNYEEDTTNPPAQQAKLSKVSLGNVWLSVEYMSARQAEMSDESYTGKFVVMAPLGTKINPDGVFTFKGNNYKIVQTFTDSSFSAGLALQQDDDMQDFTYHSIGSGSGYDVETGAMTINENNFVFSGAIDVESLSRREKNFNLFCKSKTLPFEFQTGRYITIPNGDRVRINATSKDTNAKGQIKLYCEGS